MSAHEQRTIIIAVDFGTTFTAVAWAIKDEPDNVEYIRDWPNFPGLPGQGDFRISGKVPTKFRTNQDDQFQWGFNIHPEAPSSEVFEWFKLKLDSRPCVEELVPSNIRTYTEFQTDQVIFEYLSALGGFIKTSLQDRFGEAIVASAELQYVLTVPAIWDQRATQRTIRAFQTAMDLSSTGDITVVSEPEAAAVCVLQRAEGQVLSQGQCFMILDAGGGTADLISYSVRQLHPLVVDEAVPGSGDVCGRVTITNRFKAWLVSKIGNEENFDENVLRNAVESFESRVIPRVDSAALASNKNFRVAVPNLEDNAELGIRSERMTVSAGDVVSFFQPSVERIKLLVARQIDACNDPITLIIMVGGYGQSRYLRESLQADEMIRSRGIRVQQPEYAWNAVVEGAVMKRLHEVAPEASTRIRVANRMARRHYGTEFSVQYVDSIHAELSSKRRWDGFSGWHEVEVMSWFIKEGDTVTEDRPFYKDFFMTSKVNQGKPQRIFFIIYTDDESQVAPLGRTDSVHQLCTVEADLSRIPESQMAQVRGKDGYMYYHVEGKIESVYGSQTVSYTLIYNEQRYNSVTVEFA